MRLGKFGLRLGTAISGGLLLIATMGSAFAFEPSLTGLWRTIDDKTGKPRGVVRIYEENGEIFAKIEECLNPSEANEICEKCPGDRKDQPVIGLVIIRRMKKTGGEYSGGDNLDPETGAIYRCRLRLAEDGRSLEVRGYFGAALFGRSQTWLRAD